LVHRNREDRDTRKARCTDRVRIKQADRQNLGRYAWRVVVLRDERRRGLVRDHVDAIPGRHDRLAGWPVTIPALPPPLAE